MVEKIYDLYSILEKVSTFRFNSADGGECFLMTMCLTKYLEEEYGIELKTHIGGIKNISNKDITYHIWSSYKGHKIDLTSHTQDVSRMSGSILGQEIVCYNPTGVLATKKEMNSKLVKKAAQFWVDILPKDIINVSFLFLKYGKKGIVPNSLLKKAILQINRMDEYKKFYNFMKESLAS